MSKDSGDALIEINFRGPLGWGDSPECASIFSDPTADQSGIYLWTVESELGHLVFYVGMTSRSFSSRMREHLREYLSGMYNIYDISQFRDHQRALLWEGMWRDGEEVRFPDFLSKHQELWPHLWGMITSIRLHLGAVGGDNKRLLNRIEAALALHIRKQPGKIGGFQDPEIRYRPKRDEEDAIVALFRSDVNIQGLPDKLPI